MRKRLSILLAASLLLVACGGDDDSSEPEQSGSQQTQTSEQTQPESGQDVTREEYIAKADKHCEGSNARARRLNQKTQAAVKSGDTDDERLELLEPILREGLEVQRKDRAAFRAIQQPEDDRPTIDRLFASYDESTTLIEQMLEAAEARDARRFAGAAKQVEQIQERSREIAQDYGFRECGSRNNEAAPSQSG